MTDEMTIILLVIGWLIPSVVAFRYTGYAVNQDLLDGHSFRSICDRCKCTKCGRKSRNHWKGPCMGGSWAGMHPFAIFLGGVMALLWPLLLVGAASSAALKASGVSKIEFFKPAPSIPTKEQRQARRELEERKRKDDQKEEMARLQRENKRLERELGIVHDG